MQLQGIRIEYFLTGGLSFVWLGLLAYLIYPGISQFSFGSAQLLLIPVAYYMGLMIDYVGRLALNPIANKIEAKIYGSAEARIKSERGIEKKLKNSEILITILDYKPELFEQVEIRLTRYRIARGALLNIALTLLVILFFYSPNNTAEHSIFGQKVFYFSSLIGLAILGVINFFMWKQFVASYHKQQVYILRHLDAHSPV